MSVHIKVTQAHIDGGVRKDACNCPIANAAKPQATRPEVDGSLLDLGPYRVYVLPEVARNFVQAFDAGFQVAPFEFDADLIEEYGR